MLVVHFTIHMPHVPFIVEHTIVHETQTSRMHLNGIRKVDIYIQEIYLHGSIHSSHTIECQCFELTINTYISKSTPIKLRCKI